MHAYRFVLFVCAVAFVGGMSARQAVASPFYSVGSAHACNTCHVEPIGWQNPESIWDRRCTLDCQGCHVSPTGGGMRTPLGSFYAGQVLAMWGARPADTADPARFLQPGYPSQGEYRLFEGFSGWWPGEVAHREIPDRYGNIDPAPIWQVGGDFRILSVTPTSDDGRDFAAFPMQAQTYLALHPLPNLTTYLDIGLQGSRSRGVGGPETPAEAKTEFFRDILWLREIFVMLHDLPGSTYVRAGRFNLPYGWRVPDHTAYIRAGMFDQYAQGYGAEVGFAPNEYWGNLALYTQGIDNWPGEGVGRFAPGLGVTGQAGIRKLGWTLGASFSSYTADEHADVWMAGPMWGLNLHPVVYLGELDWRRQSAHAGRDAQDSLFAFHEVQLQLLTGITPKLRYEWADTNLEVRDDHKHRLVGGFEWNPFRWLQADVVFRYEIPMQPDAANSSEILGQLHAYF